MMRLMKRSSLPLSWLLPFSLRQLLPVPWLRVSTMGQVKEGYSLGEQLDEIEKFCTANGYNLVDTFRDEGISGAKADEDEMRINRDGLLDMLDR